jgi:hypothetical protein
MRVKALLAILALNLLFVSLTAIEMIWPETIESKIYNTVQYIRLSHERGLGEISMVIGRWLISWWFLTAILALLISWLVTLILASSDSSMHFSVRIAWVIAIFFASTPGVIVYCIASLLRPNNSFKPTPLRGVGRVPTLR